MFICRYFSVFSMEWNKEERSGGAEESVSNRSVWVYNIDSTLMVDFNIFH